MQEINFSGKTVSCLFVHFYSSLSSQITLLVFDSAAAAQIKVIRAEFLPVCENEWSPIQDYFFKLFLIIMFILNNASNSQLLLVLSVEIAE